MVGIAGGADVIVIPEFESDPDAVAAALRDAYTRGKRHAMVVVAEGRSGTRTRWPATSRTTRRIGFELRATILATCSAAADRVRSTDCWLAAPPRRR